MKIRSRFFECSFSPDIFVAIHNALINAYNTRQQFHCFDKSLSQNKKILIIIIMSGFLMWKYISFDDVARLESTVDESQLRLYGDI